MCCINISATGWNIITGSGHWQWNSWISGSLQQCSYTHAKKRKVLIGKNIYWLNYKNSCFFLPATVSFLFYLKEDSNIVTLFFWLIVILQLKCFILFYLIHPRGGEEDSNFCRILFQFPVLIMAELQVTLVIAVSFPPGMLWIVGALQGFLAELVL